VRTAVPKTEHSRQREATLQQMLGERQQQRARQQQQCPAGAAQWQAGRHMKGTARHKTPVSPTCLALHPPKHGAKYKDRTVRVPYAQAMACCRQ